MTPLRLSKHVWTCNHRSLYNPAELWGTHWQLWDRMPSYLPLFLGWIDRVLGYRGVVWPWEIWQQEIGAWQTVWECVYICWWMMYLFKYMSMYKMCVEVCLSGVTMCLQRTSKYVCVLLLVFHYDLASLCCHLCLSGDRLHLPVQRN